MSGPQAATIERRAESDRLRVRFLVWMGKRSYAEGFADARLRLPRRLGVEWLGGRRILPPAWQARVRAILSTDLPGGGGAP